MHVFYQTPCDSRMEIKLPSISSSRFSHLKKSFVTFVRITRASSWVLNLHLNLTFLPGERIVHKVHWFQRICVCAIENNVPFIGETDEWDGANTLSTKCRCTDWSYWDVVAWEENPWKETTWRRRGLHWYFSCFAFKASETKRWIDVCNVASA